jgi:hypothetical protein
MDFDKIVRDHLVSLLEGGNAHVTLNAAVVGFPTSYMNKSFSNGPYSFWQLLEHIRIAQWDILDFIRNPNYKYMQWPKDYWPNKSKKATSSDWKRTISSINHDSKELQRIIKNPKTNLYSKIKHGKDQTILKEVLLVADHNAYHLGEFVVMCRNMGIWKRD